MRVSILPKDGAVYIDGFSFSGLDLSSIPANVHAIQWYGEVGQVEYKDPVTGLMTGHEDIGSLEAYQDAIDAWGEAKAQYDRFQQQPEQTGAQDL